MKLIVDISDSIYADLQKIRNGSIAANRILQCVKDGEKAEQRTGHALPSVQPKETNTHELLNKIRTEILNEKVSVARCDIYDAGDQGWAEGHNTAIENVLDIIDEYLKGDD